MSWFLQVVSVIIFLVNICRSDDGIGIFYKSGLTVTMSKSEAPEMYAHFKNMDCNINIDTVIVTCSIIYRPPPYKQNGFRNSLLFEE